MIELTVSRKKKISTGKYENEEIMAAIKAEYPDDANIPTQLRALDFQALNHVSTEAEKIRHSPHTSTKKKEENK